MKSRSALLKQPSLTAAEYRRVTETEKSLQEAIVEGLELKGYMVEVTSERSHRGPGGNGQDRGIGDLLIRRASWSQNPGLVGVKVNLEVKTQVGKLSSEQEHSRTTGGLWIIRSPEEALAVMDAVDRALKGLR